MTVRYLTMNSLNGLSISEVEHIRQSVCYSSIQRCQPDSHALDVVDVMDYEAILVSLYPEEQQEAVARTLMLESEPIVTLLQENTYREVIWQHRVNEAARAVMLAYAAGSDLDQIGGNYNVERLQTTRRFRPRQLTDHRLRIKQALEGLIS